jgi:hypothetical protein
MGAGPSGAQKRLPTPPFPLASADISSRVVLPGSRRQCRSSVPHVSELAVQINEVDSARQMFTCIRPESADRKPWASKGNQRASFLDAVTASLAVLDEKGGASAEQEDSGKSIQRLSDDRGHSPKRETLCEQACACPYEPMQEYRTAWEDGSGAGREEQDGNIRRMKLANTVKPAADHISPVCRGVAVRSLFASIMPLLIAGVAHSQQVDPTTIVSVKGQCEAISLAGVAAQCPPGGGVVYSVLGNGRVLLTFAIGDGRTASFVGEKDSQPRPETYYLYLSRIRIASSGSDFTSKIAGQCIVNMSRDGRIWSTIECNATDENSAVYAFRFRSDGSPVDAQHPGAKSAAEHVDQKTVARITTRFKTVLAKGGIRAVVQDIGQCFGDALGNVPAIRACMLYDISAVEFDKGMRKMFQSRGVDPGPKGAFLDDPAFNTRMEIYSGMAFGGSIAAANDFSGTRRIG